MKLIKKSRWTLAFILSVWLFAVGFGLRLLLIYENAPGDSGAPPLEWPAESQVERVQGLPTLIMIVHPHCSCSRASLGELALLIAKVPRQVNTVVLFVKPQDFPEQWEKTDLWDSATAIPGVQAKVDEEGSEARRF